MENLPKELLRNYIKEQNFTDANDILKSLKELFRDILQESLEAEMENSSLKLYLNIKEALRILPLVSDWQNRPLEKTYSFVFMDAIHYKVKEVLGIWVGANENSKFWLSVLKLLFAQRILLPQLGYNIHC